MDLDRALNHVVRRFLDEVVREVKRAVLAEAANGLRTGEVGTPQKAQSERRRGDARVADARTDLRARLLRTIKLKPGLRAEQLRAAVGADAGAVKTALNRLRGENLVRTRGKARGTTYRAATG